MCMIGSSASIHGSTRYLRPTRRPWRGSASCNHWSPGEERRDYNTLKMELGNVQSLASARQILLTTITQYALAIAELERAKGTLLEYNNIVIAPIGE